MRYYGLATDYDGTIATHGFVDEATLKALRRLCESGRKLILVTGREIPDLRNVFSHLDLFDLIVAENGALLHNPSTNQQRPLSDPPPDSFVELLRERGVHPLSVGRVIVATNEPNETVVLAAIRELGLELQVIFNKGAVMVLPSGVNKASGLASALKELGLSRHNIVGIGDAENDHAFLECCECSAAVANALPALKERADLVTRQTHGAGVSDVIEQLIVADLKSMESRLTRHDLLLGTNDQKQEVRVGPYGSHLLVAGSPGGGKSTLVLGFLERLFQRGYQACIIDPEGDYPELEKAVIYGDSRRTPAVDAVVHALDQLQENVVVGLIGIKPEDRPAFFQKLMPALATLRARTGRPHWIIVDEAHHVLPASQQPALSGLPGDFGSTLLVTVRPQHVASSVLAAVNFVLVTGETPAQTLTDFCVATQCDAPPGPASPLPPGEALGWRRGQESVFHFRVQPPKVAHRRHLRQYAKGDLPAERSFYFEGPERKLHLRAQNLSIFLQISEGVDEETWNYHLQRGDYSAWFRTQFQDEDLALAVAIVEKTKGLSAENSRSRVRAAIEKRYSAAP